MIILADSNNYYVSAERVFRPDLIGRPVGVLTHNDNVIIARSQELKDLGVAMGTPVHLLDRQVRRQAVLLSSNFALYGDMSRRVSAVYHQYTSHVDEYSIDESFLNFRGFDPATHETRCHAMRKQVLRETGIPISIGLSTSKTLAKLANRLAKKDPTLDGVATLMPDSARTRNLLDELPVTEIWGIASRIGRKLEEMGIHTAWDLRSADPGLIRRRFSVVVERTVWELRGVDCIPIDDMAAPKRQIMTSRSFGHLTGDLSEIREAVRQHAWRGAEKLRGQQSLASALRVFVRTNPYRDDTPQYNQSIVVPFLHPTDDSRTIVQRAIKGLETIYRPHYAFQKCGVMLMDLTLRSHEQKDLLTDKRNEVERARSERLMETLDSLNRVHGAGTIRLGLDRANSACGIRSAYRTPRYTTRWKELPVVKMG